MSLSGLSRGDFRGGLARLSRAVTKTNAGMIQELGVVAKAKVSRVFCSSS